MHCKPFCNITCGFSGAGAFSDGKLNSYHLSETENGELYLGGNNGEYFKKSMTDLIGQSAYERKSDVSEGALDLHTGGSGSGKTNEEIDPSRYQEFAPGAIVETKTSYLDQIRNKYTTWGDNTNVGGLHTQFNARRQQRENNNTTKR